MDKQNRPFSIPLSELAEIFSHADRLKRSGAKGPYLLVRSGVDIIHLGLQYTSLFNTLPENNIIRQRYDTPEFRRGYEAILDGEVMVQQKVNYIPSEGEYSLWPKASGF